jgi:hypothetical protein
MLQMPRRPPDPILKLKQSLGHHQLPPSPVGLSSSSVSMGEAASLLLATDRCAAQEQYRVGWNNKGVVSSEQCSESCPV